MLKTARTFDGAWAVVVENKEQEPWAIFCNKEDAEEYIAEVILVYNDGELVHAGSLESFLADNGHDEWLTEECKKLEIMGSIEFSDISGDWLIKRERQNPQ